MALLGEYMFKDFITYAEIERLRSYLTNEGHVDEEGEPYIPLNKIPVQYYDDTGDKITISILRCTNPDEILLVETMAKDGALTILGEVKNNVYEFYTVPLRNRYEKSRKVGNFREMVVERDMEGNVVLDENGDTVKVKTSHSYMQGLFA